MREVLTAFSNIGAFVLVYLVPPVVVGLVHWAVTGNTEPGPKDGLYVLLGVWTMHALIRRRYGPEELPLL